MDDQAERYNNGVYDGISDLNYTLNDVQLRPFYTWIHANLDGVFYSRTYLLTYLQNLNGVSY